MENAEPFDRRFDYTSPKTQECKKVLEKLANARGGQRCLVAKGHNSIHGLTSAVGKR